MHQSSYKLHLIRAGLFLLILFPTLLGTFMAVDLTSWSMRLVYLLSGLGFYAFFYVLLKQRAFFYVSALFLLQGTFEVAHLLINHATMSLLFFWTIITSERSEFWELFTMYWFVLLLLIALWIVYLILVKRYVPNEYRIASPRHRALAATGIAALFALAIVLSACHYAPKTQLGKRFARTECVEGVKKFTPINNYLIIHRLYSVIDEINSQRDAQERFTFGIPSTPEGDDIVVLVIGETSRYDHWQINGYERQTSPRLCAREQQIVSFDSCYTIANLTTICVPFILTPATPEQPNRFASEKSIVEAFQEAGYHTSWIADQSFDNGFLLRISNQCDYRFYTPNLPRLKDSLLIEPFQAKLQQPGKQLIVLHTLGCHFKYSVRYPKEFRIFSPDLTEIEKPNFFSPRSTLEQIKQQLINSYDNAIAYTDYILDTIIRSVERLDRSAVVLYVGDHGENLLDDQRNMILHGTYQASEYETHVPLFMWMSDEYQERYPNVKPALQANRNKAFTTMTIFHSLLDLGHIPYQGLDTTESLVRPTLISHPIIYGLDANLNLTEMPK